MSNREVSKLIISNYAYVARQPIVDRHHELVGYELLYREDDNNVFPDVDPDVATTKLMIEQLLVGQSRVLDGKLGFINFDTNTLRMQVPLDFPHANYVVEVLESCEPSKMLYESLQILKEEGFQIALDDFVPGDKWRDYYPLIDIIKFDIRLVPLCQCKDAVNELKPLNIQLLAEKVETYDEFEIAKTMGFTLFQGFYFKKPEMIQSRKIEGSLEVSLRLCEAVAQSPFDINQLESVISSDATISFKLLNYVNACANLTTQIKSFRQAIVYMGELRIRKFASYVALSSLNPDKPPVLFRASLQRAKFFEHLVGYLGGDTKEAYLCGMLSLMDAILDAPLESIVPPLNIDKKVEKALLHREGVLGLIGTLAEAVEVRDWGQVDVIKAQLDINDQTIIACDLEAAIWVNDLSG